MGRKKPETGIHPTELKTRYAMLGNGLNTPLPIVDPVTGEELPIYCPDISGRLLNHYPEEHWNEGEIDGEDVAQRTVSYAQKTQSYTAMIKSLTGVSRLRLMPLIAKTREIEKESKDVVKETRKRIIGSLSFLAKYHDNAKEFGLRQCGKLADDYMNDIVRKFFPDQEHELSLKNEVAACNDAAQLLFMTFDTDLDTRVRYEARRKLILMKLIGEIEDYDEEEESNENALNNLIDFIDRRMINVSKGEKRGVSFQRFLVSRHTRTSKATKRATIKEKAPASIKISERVTPMGMRKAIVTNENGEDREIFFYIIPREKSTFSRLTKILRYGTGVKERDTDRNGIRMVFESKEDWEDFNRSMQEKLEKECKQRADMSSSPPGELGHPFVKIVKEEGSLDGKEEFKGRSEASGKDLKFKKILMKTRAARGGIQQYEFQVFLPEGFADYQYRKGLSWEEYHVNRFFIENLDELLFPSPIFPEIDREATRKNAAEKAYRKIWERGKVAA